MRQSRIVLNNWDAILSRTQRMQHLIVQCEIENEIVLLSRGKKTYCALSNHADRANEAR